jgi:hypothetical protein
MSDFDDLRARLAQVLVDLEAQLAKGDAPGSALEDLKSNLDGVRTGVLAFNTTAKPAEYEQNVRKYRLRRAAQICNNVLEGMMDGTIRSDTRGFDKFLSTADETMRMLEQLPRSE